MSKADELNDTAVATGSVMKFSNFSIGVAHLVKSFLLRGLSEWTFDELPVEADLLHLCQRIEEGQVLYHELHMAGETCKFCCLRHCELCNKIGLKLNE